MTDRVGSSWGGDPTLPGARSGVIDSFLESAEDHVAEIRTLLAAVERHRDRDALVEALRRIHSLKGSAGMVGLRFFSQLAHRMEDLVVSLYSDLLPTEGRERTTLPHWLVETRASAVPLSRLVEPVTRAVMDAADRTKKTVTVASDVEGWELSGAWIEKVTESLLHVVRNAVDHGIEPVSERRRLGKPDCGSVRLRASYAGGELRISISDDGRGLDLEAIRATALERGYLTAIELSEAGDDDVRNLLFSPGFTTASHVTEVSGRGMGLDVVKTMTARMGGSVEVQSEIRSGCRVLLRLPAEAHGRCLEIGEGDHDTEGV